MLYAAMRDVTFGYNGIPVLDQVTLSIQQGQFTCITGPNGAAKSTMIRLLLTLLKPWRGDIQWERCNPWGENLSISYMPQQIASFNSGFPSTVFEFVRSGRYPKLGWFRRFTREEESAVELCLKQVGMWEFRDKPIGALSGGQKQRICIARCIAQEPDVFVLDEPTAGMDQESRKGFYELLRHYVTDHGKTVLMVTHEVNELQPYMDHRIELERSDRGGWRCFTTASCNEHFGPVA